MKTHSDFMVEFVQADIACGISKAAIIKKASPSIKDDLKDTLNPDGRSFNTKHDAYVAMRDTFLFYAMPMYLELETIPKGYSKAQVLCERKAWTQLSDSVRDALGEIRERESVTRVTFAFVGSYRHALKLNRSAEKPNQRPLMRKSPIFLHGLLRKTRQSTRTRYHNRKLMQCKNMSLRLS